MKGYIIYRRKKKSHFFQIKEKKMDQIFFLKQPKNQMSLHFNQKFKKSL